MDYELEQLVYRLNEIKDMGWIQSQRAGNQGGVGNTLEDLLGIAENNLQLPDIGNWEIKTRRSETVSLLTLFHSEPEPRRFRIVPQILLPNYGWRHQEAGYLYSRSERSFRQTISGQNYSDRGFIVKVDRNHERIYIDFSSSRIQAHHSQWKDEVSRSVGLGPIVPAPFWTFDTIAEKLETKLKNTILVHADTRIRNGVEYFQYRSFEIHANPSLESFLYLVEQGRVYVDFDARTGHNHGTKFRISSLYLSDLYQDQITLDD